MIKAKSKDGLIILGIDKENVKRLQEGQPIYVRGQDLAIANDIVIVYGETTAAIQKDLNIPPVQ